jgi:hypothetical protein
MGSTLGELAKRMPAGTLAIASIVVALVTTPGMIFASSITPRAQGVASNKVSVGRNGDVVERLGDKAPASTLSCPARLIAGAEHGAPCADNLRAGTRRLDGGDVGGRVSRADAASWGPGRQRVCRGGNIFCASMDPNLFHLDWERTFEVLATVVILSFFLERALALFFENRRLLLLLNRSGMKEWIALVVALILCTYWDFDAVSMIVLKEKTTFIGYLLTAAVIAGGSKGALKLFHDVMNVKSSALREYESSGGADAAPEPAPAGPKPK